MFDTLNDDVLGCIARCIGDPAREVDDVARDAASLAMVGSPATSSMSKVLWKRASDLARVLDPCPRAESLASGCISTKITPNDVRSLALACRIRNTYEWSIVPDMQDNDTIVGRHCPIPRAAAYYILVMSRRCMARKQAERMFRGRDLSACRFTRKRVRFSDLRRAPPSQDKLSPEQERLQSQLALDRHFEGRVRPWFVRTEAQAQRELKKERVMALGYDDLDFVTLGRWDMDTIRNHREVCDELELSGVWGDKSSPHWDELHRLHRAQIPPLFRDCVDAELPRQFTVQQLLDVKARVASNMEVVEHLPSCILEGALAELKCAYAELNKFGTSLPFTMANAVRGVFLHTASLPAGTALGGSSDWDKLVDQATWAASMHAIECV